METGGGAAGRQPLHLHPLNLRFGRSPVQRLQQLLQLLPVPLGSHLDRSIRTIPDPAGQTEAPPLPSNERPEPDPLDIPVHYRLQPFHVSPFIPGRKIDARAPNDAA